MKTGESVGSVFQADSARLADIDERKGDIFEDGEILDEIEILEDKADFFGADFRLTSGTDTGDIFIVQDVFTTGGTV